MKKFLLAFLICPLISCAQFPRQKTFHGRSVTFELPAFDILTKKTDTVRVIMLVCDTARQQVVIPVSNQDSFSMWVRLKLYDWLQIDSDTFLIGHVTNVDWKYGYRIQYYPEWGTDLVAHISIYPEQDIYLDDKKNRLPPNIIVWQALQVK